jgi:glutamate dehydrogenase (NAD(P)+)
VRFPSPRAGGPLFGDIDPDAEEAFAHIRRSMRSLRGRLPARADADGTAPRAAAHAMAADGLPKIAERLGWYG